MNFLRKLVYQLGLKQTDYVYKVEGGTIYRFKENYFKDDEWVKDDPMLRIVFAIRDGEQQRIRFTDYGCIGSKMMYMFYAHDNRCTYSSESILVDLGKDYRSILGYYPKKLFFTKVYE